MERKELYKIYYQCNKMYCKYFRLIDRKEE